MRRLSGVLLAGAMLVWPQVSQNAFAQGQKTTYTGDVVIAGYAIWFIVVPGAASWFGYGCYRVAEEVVRYGRKLLGARGKKVPTPVPYREA